jgi:hypothetical protein
MPTQSATVRSAMVPKKDHETMSEKASLSEPVAGTACTFNTLYTKIQTFNYVNTYKEEPGPADRHSM